MRPACGDGGPSFAMIYPRCYRRMRRACFFLGGLVAACLFLKVSVLPLLLHFSPQRSPGLIDAKDPLGPHLVNGALYTGQSERHVTYTRPSSIENASQPALIPRGIGQSLAPLRTIKVLILAYYRTGSSLTGSFFDAHPSTFYSFEPLHSLHKSYITKRSLHYFNGHTRPPPTKGKMDDLTFEILEAYLKCDFENLNWKTLTTGFLTKSTSYDQFIHCVRSLPGQHSAEKVRKHCIPPLRRRCLSSSAIVIKSIRVSMHVAERLLRAFPELKIIHLQRDPRGMACSMHRGNCMGASTESIYTCGTLSNDTSHKRKLPTNLSSQILDVTYESLVQNPLKVVKDAFDFVGIAFHPNVARRMYDCFYSGEEGDGTMSMKKANPLATAYRWTSVIHWQIVDMFQLVCKTPMIDQGYTFFKNLREVRMFKIPAINKTQQGLELKRYFSSH